LRERERQQGQTVSGEEILPAGTELHHRHSHRRIWLLIIDRNHCQGDRIVVNVIYCDDGGRSQTRKERRAGSSNSWQKWSAAASGPCLPGFAPPEFPPQQRLAVTARVGEPMKRVEKRSGGHTTVSPAKRAGCGSVQMGLQVRCSRRYTCWSYVATARISLFGAQRTALTPRKSS